MSFFSQGTFNANEIEPAQEFAPIPVGEYTAIISEAVEIQKMFRNKDTGQDVPGVMIKLVVQICQGPQDGRKLFENLCVQHPNNTAQEIALQNLSAICRAIGVAAPKSVSDLCNKPMTIKVKHEKRKDNGETQARVGAYKARASVPAKPAPKQESGVSYESAIDDESPF